MSGTPLEGLAAVPTQRRRLTLPGRSRRPGAPAAPTPVARAPGSDVAHIPSAPIGTWQGAGGETASRPPPHPSKHTHLLPGEGCEEGEAAPLLQVQPLSPPVEVLVARAAAKEQKVSWGNTGWP